VKAEGEKKAVTHVVNLEKETSQYIGTGNNKECRKDGYRVLMKGGS
jgi:hypothetical protein